jgi:2-polyprenyl-3-methyl-5-hydroxy-6-metoxy-1,4-benzoquinol methylase
MVDEHTADLNARTREAWERNAAFWDQAMGDGNRWNLQLIRPAVERALGLDSGWEVLDAGCGNGQISRWLADKGARVTGFDFSAPVVQLARERSAAYQGRVEFLVLDGTDKEALLSLGQGRFDAVVSTMVLMDMAAIEPLIEAAYALLKPNGRFVFSVPHPCFNTSYTTLLVERTEGDDGNPRTDYAVRVARYKTAAVSRGIAMLGQPEVQYYFNRPLEMLFAAFFERGFALDYLEEPAFRDAPNDGRVHWANFTEIPPVLVVRMRPVAAA